MSRDQIDHIPKKFDQLFIFVNSYQHAKNEAVSNVFWKIVDLKILQCDWLKAFWPTPQGKHFSQYRICAGTQQIKIY